jgi:valyl-tRNA synthetase
MPFITEDIYTRLPGSAETIMRESWPEYEESFDFGAEAECMNGIMELVRAIRNVRAEMNVPPAKRAHMFIVTNQKNAPYVSEAAPYFNKLAGASEVTVQPDKSGIAPDAVSVVSAVGDAFIPLNELIDIEKELTRLEKERARVEGEIKRAEGKLSNQGFIAKAPEKVVEEERTKLKAAKELYEKLAARIAELGK